MREFSAACVFAVVTTVIVLVFASARPATAQLDPPDLWEVVEVPGLAPVVTNGASAWADIDDDGDMDLFVTGFRETQDASRPYAQLYRNQGDYTLPGPGGTEGDVPATDYVPVFPATDTRALIEFFVWRSAVAWNDFDGDGKIDLATTGVNQLGSTPLRIYRNVDGDGSERVLNRAYELPGVTEGALAWGDYDNDGDPDLVISGLDATGVPVTRLVENNVPQGGLFELRTIGAPGLWQSAVDWGDFDNDRDLDLLIGGIDAAGAFITKIFRNDGNDVFSDTGVDLPGLLNGSVAWGDGDADGDLDVLLTGGRMSPFLIDGNVFVFRNDAGTFTDTGVQILGRYDAAGTGRFAGDAAWGDFNNDGYPDFFVSGFASTVSNESGRTYESQGDMHFVYSTVGFHNGQFLGGGEGSTFWGDYDGDGDLDMFSTGQDVAGFPYARAYRNFLPYYPSNMKPNPPGSPEATVQGNDAVLSWSPGSDGAAPAGALTYNIRVGTGPGADDVMPSNASSAGRRLLSAPGNAGHNLGWNLKNLNPGIYYWSVQTIDAAYLGSDFSEEGFFTIQP